MSVTNPKTGYCSCAWCDEDSDETRPCPGPCEQAALEAAREHVAGKRGLAALRAQIVGLPARPSSPPPPVPF